MALSEPAIHPGIRGIAPERHLAERRFRTYGRLAAAFAGTCLLVLLCTMIAAALPALMRDELRLQPAQVQTAAEGDFTLLHGRSLTALAQGLAGPDATPEQLIVLKSFVTPLAFRHVASTDTPAVPLNRQARLGLSTLKAGKELSVASDGLTFTNDRAILPRLGSVSSEHTHKLLITREGVFAGPDGDTSLDLVLPLLLGPETPHLVAINARSDLPERELLELAWLLALNEAGFLERNTNLALFTRSESTFPELYGALGALLGSLLIMLVTASLAIPVAIAAAIWLSEFARPGRLMTTVEVSINNLAAVPSILFGLIGASVLIAGISIPWPFGDEPAVFGVGMGRGWPLVAGIVLALVVFPTVVIASRAALDAVPDQVRQSALALGATTMQTALHHVVPQALPATMTGVILGLSRAIGETPPLLLIGMLAFVADPPRGITDPSTALPVKIYDLSKSADPQWIALGAALSIILLVLMLALNACAIFLRQLAEGQE